MVHKMDQPYLGEVVFLPGTLLSSKQWMIAVRPWAGGSEREQPKISDVLNRKLFLQRLDALGFRVRQTGIQGGGRVLTLRPERAVRINQATHDTLMGVLGEWYWNHRGRPIKWSLTLR